VAILLLGSNVGDRSRQLDKAIALLGRLGSGLQASRIYETEPWGNRQQARFLNQVVTLQTGLSARALLAAALETEEALGRRRAEKWAPRSIDIDILFFGDDVIAEPDLQVPHPQIPFRRFALVPLAELLPDFIHPTEKKTIRSLLDACTDPLGVVVFSGC
jgi:2-amino-4-hydroxy-6-hydroxymethyldihydropteridine diphosphokinase